MEKRQEEFRIVLPISLEQYRIGQLYTVAQFSKDVTGPGQGFTLCTNEPATSVETGEKFQYTMKEFDAFPWVPRQFQMLGVGGSHTFVEESQNNFPKCKSTIRNPNWLQENFYVKIFTDCRVDYGESENVFGLTEKERKNTPVINVDIAEPPRASTRFSKQDYDPTKFQSTKTDAGPLAGDWAEALKQNKNKPHMCVYKLINYEIQFWNIQAFLVRTMQDYAHRVISEFYRRLYCTIDEWNDLTMEDIRKIEEKTKQELLDLRSK